MAAINTSNDPNTQDGLNADPDPNIVANMPKDIRDLLHTIVPIESYIDSTAGPFVTIDVQPDCKILFASLFSELMPLMDELTYDKHELISPASVLLYCYYVLYCYGAANDTLGLRFTASSYANTCYSDSVSRQTLHQAMYLNVPPFLADYTRTLASVCDAQRQNMAFINTYASFDLYHDLARTLPINLFCSLHNILARARPHITVDNILHEWYQHIILRYNVANQPVNVTVANILGTNPNQNIYENATAKMFRQLVTNYLNKPVRQRPVLRAIPYSIYSTNDGVHDINPYWYLIAHTPRQCNELSMCIDQISTFIADKFTRCCPLYQVYEIQSGQAITNHYYVNQQLPTSHTLPSAPPYATTLSDSEFATAIGYAQPRTQAPSELKVRLSEHTDPTTGEKRKKINLSKAAFMYTTDKPQDDKDPDLIISHDDQDSTYPNILLYSPWSTGVSSLARTITTGLLIESAEIDGFKVPQPNIASTLYSENAIYLSSAVPFTRCNTRYPTTINHMYLYNRPDRSRDEHPVSVSMYDISEQRLPSFPPAIDYVIPSPMPGFQPVNHVKDLRLTSSKFAYNITPGQTQNYESAIPKYLHLWSSYRWVDTTAPHGQSARYFLANLRTIYGSNPLLVKASHPLYTIPNIPT